MKFSVMCGLGVVGARVEGTGVRAAGPGVRRMEGVSGLDLAEGGSGIKDRWRLGVFAVSGVAVRGGGVGRGGSGPGRSTEYGVSSR